MRRAWYANRSPEVRERARAYYAANREKLTAMMRARAAERRSEITEYGKQWLKKDRLRKPAYYIYRSAKNRAKARGMEFSISRDDVVIPDFCPVLGIPIVIETARPPKDNSPSLDRIDNSLGYVPGNVRVISYRANAIKRDMTLAEARLLVKHWYAR